jgi:hypothetical protein
MRPRRRAASRLLLLLPPLLLLLASARVAAVAADDPLAAFRPPRGLESYRLPSSPRATLAPPPPPRPPPPRPDAMIETTTIDPQTDPVVVAARASLFDAVAAELSRDLVVASQQASHTSTDYDPYDLDRFDAIHWSPYDRVREVNAVS